MNNECLQSVCGYKILSNLNNRPRSVIIVRMEALQ